MIRKKQYALCIYKVDRIGDFILALSCIRTLVKAFEGKSICLVVSTMVQSIAESEFPRVEIIGVPKFPVRRNDLISLPFLKVFRELADIDAEALVCLRHQRGRTDEFLCSIICSRRRVAFNGINVEPWKTVCKQSFFSKRWTCLLSNFKQKASDNSLCRELLWHRSILEEILGREIMQAEIIPAFESVETVHKNYLLAAPFTSSEKRNYPLEKTAQCLDYWMRILPDFRLLIVGMPVDWQKARQLAEALRGGKSDKIKAECHSNLSDYIGMVSHAAAVFSMESATAHIATALDKKTTVLLGGGHFGHFAPWHKSIRQKWVNKEMDCYGCAWSCKFNEIKCIKDVEVEQVTRAMKKLHEEDREWKSL